MFGIYLGWFPLTILFSSGNPHVAILLQTLAKIILGFCGNEWLVRTLESDGFERYADTIHAKNKKEALKKIGEKLEQHESDTCDSSKRMSICNQCDKYKMGICTACGCMIHLKAKMLTASCPIGKW